MIRITRLSDAATTRLLVLGAYAVLTAAFIGVGVARHGLVGETIWVELSVARPGLEGFLYPYDASRRLLSVPFHLAFLMSDSSYVPLHLLNATALWLTGVFTWLIVRELAPGREFLAFCAGALALTHGADRAVGMVVMVQVRQSVVGTTAAIWCLIHAWNRRRPLWLPAAAALQALALWTYEPALLLLLAAPVFVWWWKDGTLRQRMLWTAGWLTVPLIYVGTLAYRYLVAKEMSYQAARLIYRPPDELAATFASLVADAVAFWQWPHDWWESAASCESSTLTALVWTAGIATLCFAGASVMIAARPTDASPVRRLKAAATLVLFTGLAYAPFLAVNNLFSGTGALPGFYRAHFYAAIPLAIAIAAGVAGLTRRRDRFALSAGIVLASAIVATGVSAGVMGALESSRKWTEYSRVLRAIQQEAPRLRDDTFVALLGVPPLLAGGVCEPRPDNPFYDTMWFNSALQLLYPETTLAGSYWLTDGRMSGAVRYRFDPGAVRLEQSGVTVEGDVFPYDRVVAFAFDDAVGARLLAALPADVVADPGARAAYRPHTRILDGPPDPSAVDRFAP